MVSVKKKHKLWKTGSTSAVWVDFDHFRDILACKYQLFSHLDLLLEWPLTPRQKIKVIPTCKPRKSIEAVTHPPCRAFAVREEQKNWSTGFMQERINPDRRRLPTTARSRQCTYRDDYVFGLLSGAAELVN